MDIRIYAKINAALNIVGVSNGMHLIESVMASVSLYDTLSVNVTHADISAECDAAISGTNIALTAAKRVFEKTGRKLRVKIKKGIPLGGGLGGSSADGAAVIIAAQKLFGLSDEDANSIAVTLGADVPFMMTGGFAIARGYGEKLERLEFAAPDIKLLIVNCGDVSTAECYKLSDKLKLPYADISDVVSGLKTGTLIGSNALLPAARIICPRIGEAEAIIRGNGSQPHLTGSGGCLFTPYIEKVKASLERGGFVCYDAKLINRAYDIL